MQQIDLPFASNTTAHCRSCDRQAPRNELTERVDLGHGDMFDRCRFCGSIDVDVMSPEGVAHEQYTQDMFEVCA